MQLINLLLPGVLYQRLHLLIDITFVYHDLLAPAAALEYQLGRLLLETGKVFMVQSVRSLSELLIHLVTLRALAYFLIEVLNDSLSDHFKLLVEA